METKNNEKEKTLELGDFYTDPLNKFWMPIYNEVRPKIDQFFEENIESDEELKKQLETSNRAISDDRLAIKHEKKNLKVTAKKWGNGFIVFSFFLIFGLFLIPILKKNLQVIKKFNSFEKTHLEKIKEEKNRRDDCFLKVIGRYTPQEIKDTVLSRLSFGKTLDIQTEELGILDKFSDFVGLGVVNKYTSQRRYFYDILYFYQYWRVITTSNSITITVRDGDNTYYRTLTAYHRENTPFVDLKQVLNLPTNYLPKLSFVGSEGNVTEKQYNKMKKKNDFVFENMEFVKRFYFSSNDQISLMTYFPVAIQEKFVQYDEIVKRYGLPKVYPCKAGKNLYFPREILDTHLKTYNSTASWINHFTYVNSLDYLEPSAVLEPLKNSIETMIKALLQGLTVAFLNRNISGEILEDWNKNSHVKDFSGIKVDNKRQWELHIAHIVNIINTSRKFSMVTNSADRPIVSHIGNIELYGSWFDIEVNSSSYWSRNEIDPVVVEGYTINVPYVRYYPFTEPKRIFHRTDLKFEDPNAVLSTSQRWNYPLVFGIDEDEFDALILRNNITFNKKSLNEMTTLKSAINKINAIYSVDDILKKCIEIHLDSSGFGIYLNEVPQNFNVKEFVGALDEAFNKN